MSFTVFNEPIHKQSQLPMQDKNPMRFVAIGSEAAPLQKSNPKLYAKLMAEAKAEKKKAKAEWKKTLAQ